jgi:hypothetical protein
MEIDVKGLKVLIDEEDYDLIKGYTWCKCGGGYVHAYIPGSGHVGKNIRMHRLIMHVAKGRQVDHINGNRLDNRKTNLRVCNTSENLRNRGPKKTNPYRLKGVTYDKRRGTYFARICVGYKTKWLGSFDTPEKAYQAYVRAAPLYHGEFAKVI